MKNLHIKFLVSFLLFGVIQTKSQQLCSFEQGLLDGTQVVDLWADSPFTTGTCDGWVKAVNNPYITTANSSKKVAWFVRPSIGSNKCGVRIKLETPFKLSTTEQYIHIFIYKPNTTRVELQGRKKGSPDIIQFIASSLNSISSNKWVDAVFKVKGADGILIDNLVLFPDCLNTTGRISSDFNVYFDEITISNSSSPRSVSNYCTPGGTVSSTRYIASASTQGAATELNYTGISNNDILTYAQGSPVVAYPGSTFQLILNEAARTQNKPTGSWTADVYIDWNNNQDFSDTGDYLGRITSQTGKGNYTALFSKYITVPASTLPGAYRLRVKLTDSSDTNIANGIYAPCTDVKEGKVLDFDFNVATNSDKPTIILACESGHESYGTVKFENRMGLTAQIANGVELTAIATPNPGYTFAGWMDLNMGTVMSYNESYTFSAAYDMTLVARFAEDTYCVPQGEGAVSYYLGQAAITIPGQTPVYYIGSESQAETIASGHFDYRNVSGVNIPRGSSFILKLKKADGSSAFDGLKATIFADWNGNHVFEENELVTSLTNLKAEENITINIPAEAALFPSRLRVRLTDTNIATGACDTLGNGIAYDLAFTVIPNINERFVVSALPTIEGAGTFTLNAPSDNGKYPYGSVLEITAVPANGFKFEKWMKNGEDYGATMVTNNPLPITVTENLNLQMKISFAHPEYCAPTGPTNNNTDYGLSSGAVLVNGNEAFTIVNDSSVNNLIDTCHANVGLSDQLQFKLTGKPNTTWSYAMVYVDWNGDGIFGTDERYIFHRAVGYSGTESDKTTMSNSLYSITVPKTAKIGGTGMRLIVDEDPIYHHTAFEPCPVLYRGTAHTFGLIISPSTMKGDSNTGIKEESSSNSSFFSPNPVKDNVTILSAAGSSIEILNLIGNTLFKAIAQSENSTINLSFLPMGNYVLRVINGESVQSSMFIKIN